MTLTAMIGALVALLPPALLPPKDKDSEASKLARSHARLLDHIQSLEQELLTERHRSQTLTEEIETMNRDLVIQRHLVAHWRDEAMRVARVSRELQQLQPPHDGRNALAYAMAQQQNAQMQAQGRLAQYAGLQDAFANNNAQPQSYQQQNCQQQSYQQAQNFCNCVPSRAQVWAAGQQRDLDAALEVLITANGVPANVRASAVRTALELVGAIGSRSKEQRDQEDRADELDPERLSVEDIDREIGKLGRV